MLRNTTLIVAGMLASAGAASVDAAVSYTTANSTYNQNFNTLNSAGAASDLTWTNNSTLSGWSLFQAGGTAITTYRSSNGGSNSGFFYSFGVNSNSDRALGGVGSGGSYFGSPSSGSTAGYIALAIANGTGGVLNSFTLRYDGEQWRNGGNTDAQTMVLQYGFGASYGGVTTWNTPGSAFNFSSPVTGSTAGTVDGNVAGLASNRGGTISNLTWNNGQTLWVRWTEVNDAGNDHGLAIDNVSFTAVPEPASLGLLGLGAVAVLRRRRRG